MIDGAGQALAIRTRSKLSYGRTASASYWHAFDMLRGGDSGMNGNGLFAPAAPVFVGRQPELATLATALAAVRAGEPRVVLIRGDAGIGKSSLVSQFLASEPDLAVLTASCDEAEALLPYGLLQQLSAGARTLSADPLAGLDLLSGAVPPPDTDPLAVGVELMALISSLRGSAAVAVVIEDLQWIDLASARALLFACRRLAADRVLVILTCRSGGISQLSEGWERFTAADHRAIRMTLTGLDLDELSMLCQVLGRRGLLDRVLQKIAEHTGGNPLLARALLAELSDEALSSPDGSLRAPRSLAEMIQPRLAALSCAARDFVTAASVLGDHSAVGDVAAVADAADPAAALGEAETAGFLLERETPSGWQVSFVHLLVRQAVYADLGAERRRGLHLRAAAILGREESLAHRSAATVGPDRQLASDLDEAADTAVAAGNLRRAARLRQQAATATACGRERDERTLSSFELLVRAADVAQAEDARRTVERLPASARRDAALGQLALLAARPLDARSLLQAAWDAHDPLAEAARGAEAALGLGLLCQISGSLTESAVWLDRALASAVGGEPWYGAARSLRAVPLALGGAADKALSLFRDLPPRAAMVPADQTDSLTYRGLVKLWTGDAAGASDDLEVAANRIRSGHQARFPCQPLVLLAETDFRRGRWDDCQDHAQLAVSLARDAHRYSDLPFAHSAAARVPACRGDWDAAAQHVEAAEARARIFGGLAEIFSASARSILGFARDDPDEVLRGAAVALAVPEIDCYDDPAAFWWRPLQIWALIRSGRLGHARPVLAEFESRAATRGHSLALLNATWLGGLLAAAHGELERAGQMLGHGCSMAGAALYPFHRGLLNLGHGRCLSRLQQRKAAIIAVRAAGEVFSALEAEPFVAAAAAELTALGVKRRGSGDSDLAGLTAQELRVARLVAAGSSNRQAAAQLHLSPKTVEYHLASVFTKLGISNRHQLAARIGGADDQEPFLGKNPVKTRTSAKPMNA
jgi:DNA-binding CsgD family transcriptional regulator